MLSYRNRLLLIGGVVTIAVLGTVFLQAPAPTLTVDELMEDKSSHLDEQVAVRGEIRDGSINETSMTIRWNIYETSMKLSDFGIYFG